MKLSSVIAFRPTPPASGFTTGHVAQHLQQGPNMLPPAPPVPHHLYHPQQQPSQALPSPAFAISDTTSADLCYCPLLPSFSLADSVSYCIVLCATSWLLCEASITQWCLFWWPRIVPPPPNANIVGCRWLYRNKCETNRNLKRYKGRLVA